MKRLISAGILLTAILAFCITGSFIVEGTYKEFRKQIKVCEGLYESDNDAAAQKAKEIKKDWEKSENYLSIFVNHDTVDEIAASVSKLKPYAKNKSDVDFYAQIDLTQMMLHQMIEDQRITIHSIF